MRKQKNARAKYGIRWRYFGIKIQSKFEIKVIGLMCTFLGLNHFRLLFRGNQLKINAFYDFYSIIKNLQFSSEID